MTDKNSFTREELIDCGMNGLRGPGSAQLPVPPMLMFDRITSITADGGEYGKGHILAELDVHKDLWFFDCHFPGDPVMPGCLGLDALWQLVGFFPDLVWRARALAGPLAPKRVKFTGQVTAPCETRAL